MGSIGPTFTSTDAGRDLFEVSVVVPCLDEAATLGSVIEKAWGAFARMEVSGEVVVADNGSTDGSQEIARRLGARVVPVEARGYGHALRAGMQAARGRYIVFADADDTYDLGELVAFVERMRSGADMVMGTRLPPGKILPGANPWLNRWVGTPALTFALNRLFGTNVHDVNCGMRGITRETLDRIELRSTGMEFASEMVIKAAISGIRIEEVPVTLHPDRRNRPSHLHRWRDGWRHLEFILLHAPDQLLFLPGLAVLAVGLALALPVSLGPIVIRGWMFDFHLLFLGGTLALIGTQGVLGTVLIRDVVRGRILRPNRMASAIGAWLTLGRGMWIAGASFLVGFALDASVLITWVAGGFGPLPELRPTLGGLVLMALGAELALSAFLHAVLKRHV